MKRNSCTVTLYAAICLITGYLSKCVTAAGDFMLDG